MAEFNLFLDKLLQLEAGYQDNKNDRGNYNADGQLVGTNFGISAPKLEAYYKRTISRADMINLPKSVAISIYGADWKRHRLNEFESQVLAEVVFDGIVNHGPGSKSVDGGVTLLQKALNAFGDRLVVDGVIGSKTLAAVSKQTKNNLELLYKDYILKRKSRYYEIVDNNPSQQVFLQGWLNRLDEFSEVEINPSSSASSKGLAYYWFSGIRNVYYSPSARIDLLKILGVFALIIVTIVFVKRKIAK